MASLPIILGVLCVAWGIAFTVFLIKGIKAEVKENGFWGLNTDRWQAKYKISRKVDPQESNLHPVFDTAEALDRARDGHARAAPAVNAFTGVTKTAWVAKWKPLMTSLPMGRRFTLNLKAEWTSPKEFAHPQSNEDASAWVAQDSRAAVFDGATESFAARRWARLLAKTWSEDSSDFLDNAFLGYDNHEPGAQRDWMHSAAAERGSFSTIAAVQAVSGGFVGTIVGDSCILLVQGSRIAQSFPYTTSEEFNSAPDALATAPEARDNTRTAVRVGTWNIPCEPGSVTQIVLATDGVAAWLLTADDAARVERLARAQSITAQSQWDELVVSERASGNMHVDDSTIMILDLNFVQTQSKVLS